MPYEDGLSVICAIYTIFRQERSNPEAEKNPLNDFDKAELHKVVILYTTSCAGGRHNMPPPLQVDL